MSGESYRTRRRSDLSQHFLRSPALAASLVGQTSISSGDLVVEIGAGRGALTRQLALRCGHLVAVEIDGQLVDDLRAQFGDAPHVRVVQCDFLRFDLPERAYKVFGSIPFGRTAEIVRRLVTAASPPVDAYLIVQREAAERFTGAPYAAETLPSLLVKPWWQVEIVRRLRRTDFAPPPRVVPVLLWLARRTRPLISESQTAPYRQFITLAFGRGGGTARKCLRRVFTATQIGRLARELRFESEAPPSALTFDQWLGLFRYFSLANGQRGRTRTPVSAR